MKHYGYFRSSAAYRTRIALNLKRLDAEPVMINLAAGAQFDEAYRRVNPQSRVPALEVDGEVLFQSNAIIEYLDETHPEPPLLPGDALGRARVRGLADIVACDIHPVNNVAILRYLAKHFDADQDQVKSWYQHWVGQGFAALEAQLANSPHTGAFCHGETPGLADINLVPQVFNARRYECDLEPYPTIRRIDEACLALEPFAAAHPMRQPEAAELS